MVSKLISDHFSFVKQIGTIVSTDQYQLVTICHVICATEKTVPPMFVSPHVHFNNHSLHGAPTSSIGVVHTSAWITTTNFVYFLKHFVAHIIYAINSWQS